MKRDTEQKITVEDLIRLKRAERPPAEFWATFESEIRAKQLSAIVSRRPWWDGFSRVFAVVNRHQLSFGAAAAVAMAFVGLRYMESPRAAAQANGCGHPRWPAQQDAHRVSMISPSQSTRPFRRKSPRRQTAPTT